MERMRSVVGRAPVAPRGSLVQMERDLTYAPYVVGTWRTKAWSEAVEGRMTLAKIAGRQRERVVEEVNEKARMAC